MRQCNSFHRCLEAKASDTKVDLSAGKRKRVLGEATGLMTNNKAKVVAGKEKESGGSKEKFDGIVIKSKSTTTTTPTTVRQPLKPVGAAPRRTRTALTATQPKVSEEVVEVRDEDAMAVDEQPTATTRLTGKSTRLSHRAQVREQEDDAEATRVFKKRRTSSEPPVSEAQLFEEQVAADLEALADAEPEADPEGDEWDDLDAEDADDPLMVSEYIVEIFQYMKEIEVRLKSFLGPHSLIPF